MATIDTIVIACMDRRLNGYIDSYYANEHTILLRNAGANVKTLEESIRETLKTESITKIVLLPHTSSSADGVEHGDCGAMKVTYAALKGGAQIGTGPRQGLVDQFHGESFGSVHELEKVNLETQKKALVAIIAGVPELIKRPPLIEAHLVDTHKLIISDDREHALVIARPGTLKYSEILAKARAQGHDLGIDSTYVIQARHIPPVTADIEVAATALKLNGSDHPIVVFMRNGDKAEMLREVEELKRQPFFAVTPTISQVETNGKPRRVSH